MAICDKYMENNGKYLETEKDNFWFIEMEQAIDLQKEPDSWCVGSLEDDYFDLEEIVLKGTQRYGTGYSSYPASAYPNREA